MMRPTPIQGSANAIEREAAPRRHEPNLAHQVSSNREIHCDYKGGWEFRLQQFDEAAREFGNPTPNVTELQFTSALEEHSDFVHPCKQSERFRTENDSMSDESR
jgi:hypothetical protein